MDFDIIIIGAGLSGVSAARAIFDKGDFSVAIIEGRNIGSNNPSPLTFIEAMEKYKLSDCIKAKYSSFAFHNFNGSIVSYLFSDQFLGLLDYKKACKKIFRSVSGDYNNLEFIDEYVVSIEPNTNNVSVKMRNGNKISSKLLIDASGKSQLVARQFNERSTSYYSHVYGAFFTNVKGIDKKQCCYLLPSKKLGSGGGWFYSDGKESASFGYAQITDSPETDVKTLESIFRMAREEFTPFSGYLSSANIDHVEKGVIPISYLQKFVYNNIIVVGDAAGMATNWTCMGIEPTLKYGNLAGKLAAEAIALNDPGKLYLFQDIWEYENKATFDLVARQVATFWESDHYFWEWAIKNDFSHLSPQQLIDRLRNNGHLMKKHQIIARALKYKIKSMFNKNILNAQTFIIKDQPK
jgi:digeranylgeranylglycerophospholipid reductase